MQRFGKTALVFLTFVIGLAVAGGIDADGSCWHRDFGFGSTVCVCNSTFCNALPAVTAAASGSALVYTSSKAGLRFQRQELQFKQAGNGGGQILTVDRKTTFQKIHGFGGAFTDAAGEMILSLPEAAQDLLLRSYFSADGLEYNMGRLPIGGSDFSNRQYSYDDDNGEDTTLEHFSLQKEDRIYKIPMAKRAKELMPETSGDLHIYSTVWSPPVWMKTSNKFSGFGFLKKEHYQTYADYYVKFLEAYAAEGVDIHAVSTGNEPLNGVVPFKHFNSLGWTPETMHVWIRDHFGPTIRGSKFKDVKIVAHDDQRIFLPWMMELVLADNKTADYIDIIAYHWYLNFITPGALLDAVHKDYPDKPLINTEACNGDKPWDFTRVQLGSWTRGEYYLGDIVGVMNHWTAGWIDWNLALNLQGGPTWAKNWVDAPIIVDASKGEFYLNPTFYALAHVSKFVRRDSVRVELHHSGGGLLEAKVDSIAFERPDGALVVVLINKHNSEHSVSIQEGDRGQVDVHVPARSFVTVIYW
ncbi:lysosomal acid glucosylceramidase-like isoform X2 [Thrips palmi]|uniref:Glucosylceramidase n=1 Tax=Thrips palmi TaxID=161013 RepID=A0A6P8ZBU5_THRPL|nr:lysosomal acid glucosylceramidase-like isoform X2 [Thrips palmi]